MDGFKPMDISDAGTERPIKKDESMIGEQASPVRSVCDGRSMEPEADKEDVSIGAPSTGGFNETAETSGDESEGSSACDCVLEQLLDATHRVSEQVDALAETFTAKIMHTAYEEKIVDQMHAELQKYKEDMYAQLIQPILLNIIEVRDSIMRVSAVYRAKPEGEQDIPNRTFSDYAYDLQDILEKNNVEIYRSQTGDDFTPIKQRAAKKVPAPDPSLHGKVAESISCGYRYNGRVISAENVSIYYYEKPTENSEKSEVIDDG